jgi:dTDP-4-amino-4,6-dideoxygalactose transaminase
MPITEQIHDQELSLPCNPAITLAQAEQMACLLNDFL